MWISSDFFEVKLIDLVVPILTVVAIFLAYFQLKDVRSHKRVEFTYQLYQTFFTYLNDVRNTDLKAWLFGDIVPDLDRNKLGDLLEQFEAVWSLKKKDMVDEDIFYDLFSYYIEKAQAAKSPSPFEYVTELKELEEQNLGYTPDLFQGFFELHDEILLREEKLKTIDLEKQT